MIFAIFEVIKVKIEIFYIILINFFFKNTLVYNQKHTYRNSETFD